MSNQQPPTLPEGSVMHGVTPFEWDTRVAVRYEVALEMLCQQMAAATARIAAEEAKPQPDQALIERVRDQRAAWARSATELRSGDETAITELLAEARGHIDAIRTR